MSFDEIVRIEEVTDKFQANKLLSEGWVLLSVGFCDEGVPGYQYHKYSLGLPSSVEKAKDYSVDLGF